MPSTITIASERELHVAPTGWAIMIALVAALFAFDLLASRSSRTSSFGWAAAMSAVYIGIALAFGVVYGALAGWDAGSQYFAGYILEKSLSVDNLFVFVVIMSTFAVPLRLQQRALTLGIIWALALRAVLIALGAVLISAFSFMFLVFGLVLIGTAVQLFRHRDEEPDVENNAFVRLARRAVPVSDRFAGNALFARVGGRRLATPLFLVLVAIGGADLVFALDSIPAVFGVTSEPFIVLAANAFALLGLRPLYFVVADLLDRLVYLSVGLSLILGFIGVKLVLHFGHERDARVPEISTSSSLIVTVVVLAVTVAASLLASRRRLRQAAQRRPVDAGCQPRVGGL